MNEEELEIINVTCMCDNESNMHEKTLSTYGNEGEEMNPSTSEKEETLIAHHEDPMKALGGYISIYECGKNISHST